MAFTRTIIPTEPPRDPALFVETINFRHGLMRHLFHGVVVTGIGCLFLLSALTGTYETGLMVFKLSCFAVLGYAGARLFLKYARERRARVQAFSSGVLRCATVVSHGRAFVTWKSGRDFTLIVQLKMENGRVLEKKIRSEDRLLHELHPLHDEIDILVDGESGSIFVPAEASLIPSFE
ncbi:MAG: hypothetical protein E4G96_01845 [Chrysiogenales bacterium]|nr:MAG: hypothetical protein E4G96_01845 [Chrysiogenales bacterium]